MNHKSTTINLDHDSATIYTNSDEVLKIGRNGAMMVGSGENVIPSEHEPGIIRYNKTLKQMEMSDGQDWKLLGTTITPGQSIVYAIIFGN